MAMALTRISTTKLAALLNLSESTVRRWCNEPEHKHFFAQKTVEGFYEVDLEQALTWERIDTQEKQQLEQRIIALEQTLERIEQRLDALEHTLLEIAQQLRPERTTKKEKEEGIPTFSHVHLLYATIPQNSLIPVDLAALYHINVRTLSDHIRKGKLGRLVSVHREGKAVYFTPEDQQAYQRFLRSFGDTFTEPSEEEVSTLYQARRAFAFHRKKMF